MGTIDLGNRAFSTKDVCSLTGITEKRVVDWDKKGLVKPSIQSASGRGSKRLYSYKDLLAIQSVSSLREEGASLQKIRKCILYLRKHLPDVSQPLGFCTLVTEGDTVYLVEDERTLIDTVRNQGQRAFLQLSIAAIDRELRRKVSKLAQETVEEVTVGDYRYQVEIEFDSDSGCFVAEVAGLPGCISDGRTIEEALNNAADAIALWEAAYEDMKADGVKVARGRRRRRAASA